MTKHPDKPAIPLAERATGLIAAWIAETEDETLSASLARLRALIVELLVEVEQQIRSEYEKVEA
jgi:hypothetical protein